MKFLRDCCAFKYSAILLLIYALLLALATWVERDFGTLRAMELIYKNPLFILLQAVMAVQMLGAVIVGAYLKQRRYGMVLTHVSIVLILAGALVTYLTGREGTMSLMEGETSSIMMLRDGPQAHQPVALPFSVELQDFVLTRYPGSSSPSSYESFIVLHQGEYSQPKRIFMNNTLDVGGYRIFQLSYFPDESGSVLLINQDLWGRRITYTGYALLGLGLLLSLLGRQGRVVQILGQLSRMSCLLLCLALAPSLQAQQDASALPLAEKYAVPMEEAAAFAALPMQDTRGRICPVNTFASELLRKLSREDRIASLDANQFLLGLWLVPDLWVRVPLIQIKSVGIAEKYDLPQGKLALMDLVNEDGSYKLQDEVEAIYSKEKNDLSLYDKELLKLDEKLNLLNLVLNRKMVKIFPDEQDVSQHQWYAPGEDMSHFEQEAAAFTSKITDWYLMELVAAMKGEKSWDEPQRVREYIATYQYAKGRGAGLDADTIKAELFYNEANIFARCKKAYLILGGLSLLLCFLSFACKGAWLRYLRYTLGVGVLLSFLAQSGGMGLRWYIASYAPWSNSYETMVYVAWVAVAIGLLFIRRSPFVFSISVLFAGVILFVTGLSWLDPHISPLVPVLKSAWLMFHVAVIVASYGFFGIAFLLALVNMVLMIAKGRGDKAALQKSIVELSLIQELLIWIGLALMVVGTYLGAIWANESWGRYWGWDPKETWALITTLCYTLVTHLRLIKGLRGLFAFNFASLLAFLSVLMTYFGVNYFLSGMHSYSSMSINDGIIISILCGVLFLLLLSLVARLRYK